MDKSLGPRFGPYRLGQAVNRFLDENDIPELEGRYYLEVSSPGVERPLFTPEHYARFRGRGRETGRASCRERV